MQISKDYAANKNIKNAEKPTAFQASLEVFPSKYKALEDSFEFLTKEAEGFVSLVKHGDFFDLAYEDPSGNVLLKGTDITSETLVGNSLYSVKNPLKNPVLKIVASVEDLLAKNGFGHGEKNQFSKVFDKLIALPKD